jgi:polysaccharide deacetylase 2 family uncharacterized protein YibQ
MKLRRVSLIVIFLVVLQSSLIFAKQPVQLIPIRLAIVLDDIGNSRQDLQALKLPLAITFSILPYTPHARNIANLAQQKNRELLLHVPMQAKARDEELGKGALMLNMPELEFKEQLTKTLQYLPGATGINNHMGSTLTEHIKPMQWTMDVLYKQGLYFLDSRTTVQTIAESTAKMSGIPVLRRHIFLDNIRTNVAMEKQFQRAIHIGKNNGSVVIIAHPYPETIQFLANKFEQKKSTSRVSAIARFTSAERAFNNG